MAFGLPFTFYPIISFILLFPHSDIWAVPCKSVLICLHVCFRKKLEEAAASVPTSWCLMVIPEKISEHMRCVLREFALSLLTESTLLLGCYFPKPGLTATSGPVSPFFSQMNNSFPDLRWVLYDPNRYSHSRCRKAERAQRERSQALGLAPLTNTWVPALPSSKWVATPFQGAQPFTFNHISPSLLTPLPPCTHMTLVVLKPHLKTSTDTPIRGI